MFSYYWFNILLFWMSFCPFCVFFFFIFIFWCLNNPLVVHIFLFFFCFDRVGVELYYHDIFFSASWGHTICFAIQIMLDVFKFLFIYFWIFILLLIYIYKCHVRIQDTLMRMLILIPDHEIYAHIWVKKPKLTW